MKNAIDETKAQKQSQNKQFEGLKLTLVNEITAFQSQNKERKEQF